MHKPHIPEEIRPDIIEVVDKWGKKMTVPYEIQFYLGEIYHRYITPPTRLTLKEKVESSLRCPNCLSYIFKFFNREVAKWKKDTQS